jgi:hypothetical protein
LKPLPIPDHVWLEISIDFIIDLPESKGYTSIVIITDRLSKGIIARGLPNMSVESLVS